MVTVFENGTVEVTKMVQLSAEDMRVLLRMIVVNGNDGELIHSRWSALYNAFDMVYGTDIRTEHEEFQKAHNKVSRLEFMVLTNKVNELTFVASRIYPLEFEQNIIRFM